MKEKNAAARNPADTPAGVATGDRGIEQTLGRTATLLDALAQGPKDGMRFTDLMHRTGFSKATLHRLLAGLGAHGFVELEQPGSRYFLGYQLGTWASAVNRRSGLAERARPIVQALSERVQDTAYLSLRVREMAVCLVLHEGTAVIRALPLSPGDHSALGVGSAAAAILAAIDDEDEVQRILASPAHLAYCARRGVGLEHIEHHRQRARQLGHALVDDLNPDMTGIAVALRDEAGQAIAALSVATIHSKVNDPVRRDWVLAEIREAAARLEPLLQQAQVRAATQRLSR